MAKIIVVTSGKGGVGKTTTSASFATGLALRGHKTAVIDFDVGLRNLDLIMGCERRVVYDLINVIHGEANLNQALIKDKQTRWLARITEAPCSRACWIVGRAAVMRWVLVISPVCLSWGTLKSTRMKTRLPFRSRSLTVFFAMVVGLEMVRERKKAGDAG